MQMGGIVFRWRAPFFNQPSQVAKTEPTAIRGRGGRKNTGIFHLPLQLKQLSCWLATLSNFLPLPTAAGAPSLPPRHLSIYLSDWVTKEIHSPALTLCTSVIHFLINCAVVSCQRSTQIITESPIPPPTPPPLHMLNCVTRDNFCHVRRLLIDAGDKNPFFVCRFHGWYEKAAAVAPVNR